MTSVQFVGAGEYVSVACNYSDDIVANYTWYFHNLKSVVIQNLHFEGCPRPLRLDTIAEVEISSCSFRSVTVLQGVPLSHTSMFTIPMFENILMMVEHTSLLIFCREHCLPLQVLFRGSVGYL